MRYGGSDDYKHNHYVPSFMLKYWEQRQGNRLGVWTFPTVTDCVTFERSAGRKPFPFAIAEDLYVPVIEGRRAKALEAGWLNSLETALAHVVRLAHSRTPLGPMDQERFLRFALGLFSLEQRSRYVITTLKDEIAADPILRAQITASPERRTLQLVLENIVHVTTHLANTHMPLKCAFLHAGTSDFVIADRPGFNDPRLSQRVMVLTNKIAVLYEKGQDKPAYLYKDAQAEMVETINRVVALGARDWIVAMTRDEAVRYGRINLSPEGERHRGSESTVRIDRPALLAGVTIPADDE